ASAAVGAVLVWVVLLCGVVSQAAQGFFRVELLHYAQELYLIYLPQLLMVVLLALFLQTLLANKFLAHALVVGFFVLIPTLYQYGFENRLYMFGEIAPYTYSDLNCYCHFASALFWSIGYWMCLAGVLGVVAVAFARRGTDPSFAARWRAARMRSPGLLPALAVLLLAGAGSGGWYYYNAHVLNEFRTAEEGRHRQAEYERRYKQFQRLPQPKVSGVDVTVDIDPGRRSFQASGRYTLVNRSPQPIEDVHVTDARESIDDVQFDRPFRRTLLDK